MTKIAVILRAVVGWPLITIALFCGFAGHVLGCMIDHLYSEVEDD